jgi:phage terminase small subunit
LVNFCEGIVSGKSQIQSYKDSGFKSKDDVIAHREAQKLLRLPHIKDYINIRQKQEQLKLIEKTHVTKEWVLNEFIASADRCKESKKEREHQTALNSINAMLGYLAPQVVDNRNTHVLDASKLSPDDLAELSEKLDKLSKDRKPAKVLKLVNEGK